jgi:hypothetical protein
VRDRLIVEIDRLRSDEEAAVWARASFFAKGALTKADSQLVEGHFRAQLAAFDEALAEGERAKAERGPVGPGAGHSGMDANEPPRPTGEPAASPRLSAKAIRLRDKDHRKFVAAQPCVVCGRTPADPHHLRFAQPRALGRKVSDEFTVPVCRFHRAELHKQGDDAAWWKSVNIDPAPIALALWRRTRPDQTPEALSQPAESAGVADPS